MSRTCRGRLREVGIVEFGLNTAADAAEKVGGAGTIHATFYVGKR